MQASLQIFPASRGAVVTHAIQDRFARSHAGCSDCDGSTSTQGHLRKLCVDVSSVGLPPGVLAFLHTRRILRVNLRVRIVCLEPVVEVLFFELFEELLSTLC